MYTYIVCVCISTLYYTYYFIPSILIFYIINIHILTFPVLFISIFPTSMIFLLPKECHLNSLGKIFW